MPSPLIRPDGSPFPEDLLTAVAADLGALPASERDAFRKHNADVIAGLLVARLLVVSGPGTGKSHIFLRRIERWLASDEPASILVISFVRKLVQDLDRDLAHDTRLTDAQKQHVRVFTLHKLARSIVEQSHGTFAWPFRRFFKIIAWPWREVVWDDVLALCPDQSSSDPAKVEEFENYLHLNEPDPEKWSQLKDVYFRLCAFYNAAGFADLILRARIAAEEHPELVPEQYFIVDEYQDFNLSEQALIETLRRDAKGVLLAGDDDQVLYERLKAGDPALIRALYHDSSIANGMLPFCSRCNYHITKTAAAFVRDHADAGRIGKVFLPLLDPGSSPKVEVIGCASPMASTTYVANWMQQHRDQILTRQRELVEGSKKEPYLLILAPSKSLKCLKTGREQLLKEIAAYHTETLRKLSEDYFNIAVFYSAGRRPDDNFDVRKGLRLSGVMAPRVHAIIASALRRQCNLADLDDDEVSRVLALSRSVVTACNEESDPPRLATRLAELVEVADQNQLAKDLATRPLSDSAIAQLQSEQVDATEQQGTGVHTGHVVELLTIVGAKGLSADHVIILGCDDVSMAHVSPKTFFVGLTRGRESLQLLANVGAIGAKQAHAYLLGLPTNHVSFSKFKKKGGLVAFRSADEFRGYFETLASVKRQAGKPKGTGF